MYLNPTHVIHVLYVYSFMNHSVLFLGNALFISYKIIIKQVSHVAIV